MYVSSKIFCLCCPVNRQANNLDINYYNFGIFGLSSIVFSDKFSQVTVTLSEKKQL